MWHWQGVPLCLGSSSGLSLQSPEQSRPVAGDTVLRGRALSPRRPGPAGDSRFHLPPRIHRASDPGLPGRGAAGALGGQRGRCRGRFGTVAGRPR